MAHRLLIILFSLLPQIALAESVLERLDKLEHQQAEQSKRIEQIEMLFGVGAKVKIGSSKLTDWQVHSPNSLVISVKFNKPFTQGVPHIFTSLRAHSHHLSTRGTSSIYCSDKRGFKIFVERIGMTVELAKKWGFTIDYIAVTKPSLDFKKPSNWSKCRGS